MELPELKSLHNPKEGGVNSRPAWSNFFLLFLLATTVSMSSCGLFSGGPDKGIKSESLKIDFKRGGWNKVNADLADHAFRHDGSKSFLLINSLCRKYDRTTLKQLTDNLLAGLQNSTVLEQSERKLFSRSSLRTIASGSLDGVSTSMLIEVVRRDRCIYDFALISPEKTISKKLQDDFDQLLKSSKVVTK